MAGSFVGADRSNGAYGVFEKYTERLTRLLQNRQKRMIPVLPRSEDTRYRCTTSRWRRILAPEVAVTK